jgi:LacI family transcriptional regulator
MNGNRLQTADAAPRSPLDVVSTTVPESSGEMSPIRKETCVAELRRIALLIGQDLSFCREVIRGIRAYALRKSDWAIRNGPPDVEIIPSLREWKPDGIIAELFHAEFARKLLRMRKPVVDTAFWLPNLKIPVVDVDHAAVGRMAAEYLLSLSLTRFAFFGSALAEYSRVRQQSFQQRLREAGYETAICHGEYLREAPTTTSWKKMESQTRRWLRQLPKPVGLFASNDVLARSLTDTCSQLGLHVPDEVALLGVDNDELECLLTSPPLSSIAIPGGRIGYEAAKLLDQTMDGPASGTASKGTVPFSLRRKLGHSADRVFLPPIRVVARQSTDTMATGDPVVMAALRYIHSAAIEGVNVAGVVHATSVGRRELERKFRAILGRSVLQELRRVRIEQAQKLLAGTDLPMPAIAKLSGFSSAHRLTIVFHRLCGMPPTAYRRQSQIRD